MLLPLFSMFFMFVQLSDAPLKIFFKLMLKPVNCGNMPFPKKQLFVQSSSVNLSTFEF